LQFQILEKAANTKKPKKVRSGEESGPDFQTEENEVFKALEITQSLATRVHKSTPAQDLIKAKCSEGE
jgi:hypothetical protein